LSSYDDARGERLGFDVNIMLRIREFLNALSDDRTDRIMRLCRRLKLDESLSSVEEIDFQGRTVMSILRGPRSWPMLLYAMFLYLSANP
jgi:hypothetical protein